MLADWDEAAWAEGDVMLQEKIGVLCTVSSSAPTVWAGNESLIRFPWA